jgi:hypothetical protein
MEEEPSDIRPVAYTAYPVLLKEDSIAGTL